MEDFDKFDDIDLLNPKIDQETINKVIEDLESQRCDKNYIELGKFMIDKFISGLKSGDAIALGQLKIWLYLQEKRGK